MKPLVIWIFGLYLSCAALACLVPLLLWSVGTTLRSWRLDDRGTEMEGWGFVLRPLVEMIKKYLSIHWNVMKNLYDWWSTFERAKQTLPSFPNLCALEHSYNALSAAAALSIAMNGKYWLDLIPKVPSPASAAAKSELEMITEQENVLLAAVCISFKTFVFHLQLSTFNRAF